ncbi:zinc metalloprotease HtpX [Candidatus Curtissbacteria bacterium RIFCSPHIGHO2_01_FULL_41_44]|uniref:Protease HtpX homolog n=1 Tax=Candidatus Curtissbacteria bacterium RIFCSPLOWO2_01_FULL_42_50 TaxID=1797730 RepID=A0A1F5H4M4_9BACT|nr:MAG: zinc metalloprotease HtpX [Candidatus Curtissbacteria bacterium RIFCSPHIGHO2_01_FULL_41_44]OGD93280.1 MAG: zinc metalloprotease HtpX [Candidatus Curtissbacteria bacterium RIFCSPHIGHO2_02_FULL_42_58]OGD96920.1 MAG: zinc metalloprotease HtpX [Candidatus Curtissbacteria bacterium RIFCSPHIGHO2_12_FULL_42_33]OGD98984.1 MAG: zinc metalloprotease HtpX [Candidatus Curtissbacteria bacterium RIFCSPLOWO2_01_FULL_42_50]OGE03531.1 MAG: zinc metalloprotease HtpX [Candidatus Curtissbacteria bacterium 
MLGFGFFVTFVVYIFTQALGFEGPSALGFSGIALIIAGIMNFVAYYTSDKMVMAVSAARQIQKKDNPMLFRTVENLCIAAGLPTPKIYIIDDTAPNAFATGRDPKHAAIAFTTGILSKLYRLELEGVTAHELSHVGNYDTRLMTIVSILVGTVALLADFFFRLTFYSRRERDRNSGNGIFLALGLVMAILAPIVAMLIQLAISRKREFLADASGALLTRNPDGLADALLKIAADKEPLEVANKATAHLYIVNPLKNHKDAVGWFAGLFQTHPPIQERVKALRAMQ